MSKADTWFNDLYKSHKAYLTYVAYYMLGDESLAEDFVHDVYLLLYTEKIDIRNHPNPKGYLVKCVRNLVWNWYKRAENRLTDPLTPEHEMTIGVEDKERMEHLLPFSMSELDRQLVLLHLDQGLTYEEVGKILGISARACEGRMYRLKNHFKKNFDIDAWDFIPLEK